MLKKKVLAMATSLTMMLSMMTGNVVAATYEQGQTTPIFCQFYAQNQSGSWEWMSTESKSLKLGETQTLTYSAVDGEGNSLFSSAGEDATFGLQLGDSSLTAGDQSKLKADIESIKIVATDYEEVQIDLEPSTYEETYLAKEVSWGIEGNTTSISLKDYLGQEPLAHLKAITTIEVKITLESYEFIGKTAEEETVDMTYEIGDLTEVICQFYAQNQSGSWEWMSAGSSQLNFGEEQTFTVDVPADTFAIAQDDAVFGFQFADTKLGDGDRSKLKVILGQMLIKAEGYDDVVIQLDPNTYAESYLAEKASWGITNNATMIDLSKYLGEDFLAHLNAITSCEVTITLADYAYTKAVQEGNEFEEGYTHPTEMRGLTGKEIVADMKIGWNLGNTLDSLGGETAWGNPKTRKVMIDEIKKAGFNTIRVPITWDDYLGEGPDYAIDSAYLDRVEEVVNYGLANDMYVILNIHHNYGWLQTTPEAEDVAKAMFARLWTQIADRFKDYGDQLIFETMNEPHEGDDWSGHSAAYDIINSYNTVCYNTIRQSGGNNEQRLLMMPTYAATSNEAAITAFKLPNPEDQYVAVSIHAYTPYNFAMDTSATSESTWGTDQDKKVLDNLFYSLKTTFIDKGIPVVIGEFGSTNKDNLEYRAAHAGYYIEAAKKCGIPCVWWDNGVTTFKEGYGLFNRRSLEWIFPEMVTAMMEACKTEGGEPEYDPTVLFTGKATSSDWGQAVSLAVGTDILLKDLTEGIKIAVAYQSKNAPELILQSWSGGPGWVKIAPSEVKEGIAYFTYEDMAEAYATGLTETTTEAFPHLDRVYIGDTGEALTVTKVYYVLPPVLVESVSFSDLPVIHANETIDLNEYLVVLPENATDKTVKSWKSSNEKVASIDEHGILTTHQSGYTTISATMNDGDLVASTEMAVQSDFEYSASFNVSGSWDNGLTGEITISNLEERDIEDWTFEFVYDGEITNIWNAKIESHEGNQYVVKNLGWNKTLQANSSITIGFVAKSDSATVAPDHYNLLAGEKRDSSTQYTAEVTIKSSWDRSFVAEVKITNTSEEPINGWLMSYPFTGEITDTWGFTMSQDGKGNYLFKNLSYNGVIAPGQSITIGFVGTVDGETTNTYDLIGLAS